MKKENIQKIARLIKDNLPEGYNFAVIIVNEDTEENIIYASDCDQNKVAKIMGAVADKMMGKDQLN